MTREFSKAYDPNKVESRWYETWQKNKIYKVSEKSDKKPYSILMPPPNITGILHFGHILNNTIQDLYIRWKRMTGFNVCWFPGIDHAGIATQTRIEQELKKENLTRYDIGREQFMERVWQWKELYGGIILKQMRLLGVSCDWDRTLFTMDETACNAVREVFIRLFDEGLIYKGKRIINWSPLSQTALSDEEVEFREVKEHLYTLKYYFENGTDYLKVATVRPETIFGDVAVAVNPNDERFKKLIGQKVIVPLADKIIPVIADDYADPTFGTGCVKITPAHDPNDFEVGKRHNLEMPNSMNPDATLNELSGEFNGLDRFKARKMILQKLEENELIEKIDDYTHNVGFSQRGGEPVEPYLSDQWFVDMKPLAEEALKVVLEEKIKFYPNHWVKTYQHWMTNIRDWCISRQLWWGHRIPVYYSPDGQFTAADSEDSARKKLNLPEGTPLKQDEDVVDTWFSSWLWPLTTMHWLGDGKSETNPVLEKFLPTDLMVTAPDIIFFWVARMIMATTKFKGQIPFKDVYFTSLIRDGSGRKLSKSLGNSPDPIEIINKYGSDAVRFTTIYLSPLGQDVKMDVDVKAQDIPSMEIGRNFANKIWNAGRFLLMNKDNIFHDDTTESNFKQTLTQSELSFTDKWILSKYNTTIRNIGNSLDNYKVNDYSKILFDFIWRDFCDWYVEVMKVQINNSANIEYKKKLISFAIDLYDKILILQHPIMPFITEEIWHLLDEDRTESQSISLLNYPVSDENIINITIEENFALLQSIVEEIRALRAGVNIPPKIAVEIIISCKDSITVEFIKSQTEMIQTLGKCSLKECDINLSKPNNSLSSIYRENEIFMILDSSIDLDKERLRLNKEIERLERNIGGSEKKISNPGFVAKAGDDIVNYEKEKLQSMKESLLKVKSNLESLVK